MFERLSLFGIWELFWLKSFFLNSDSKGTIENFLKNLKKFYYFFNF